MNNDTIETVLDGFTASLDTELATTARKFPRDDTSPVAVRRRLTAYRDVLARRRDEAAALFDSTKAGIAVARMITVIVDRFVVHAYRLAVAGEGATPGLAIIGLGGYGRRELNPFSDVDILCLSADASAGVYDARVRDMLQFLWDMNFDLGHSTRTTSDCLVMASDDGQFATSLLDARFITGDTAVWDDHRVRWQTWLEGDGGRLLALDKIDERARRLSSYHDTVQIQEPNVKESPGALRDIHAARWLGMLTGHGSNMSGFREAGYLTEREASACEKDIDFFLSLRHALHFLNGKRSDLLDHLILPDAARKMGYEGEGRFPIERLMHDYYMRAGRVRRLTDRIIAGIIDTMNGSAGRSYTETRDGVLVGDGDVRLPDSALELLHEEPRRIIALFAAAGERGLPIGGDTATAVEDALERGNIDLTGDAGVRASVHRLFNKGRGVARTLRLMHEYGVLTRLVPEFDDISWHFQYDYYHTYTTDEHSIRVVENLERMGTAGGGAMPELREMMEDVSARGALFLAGLLHDIGKKEGRGHAHRGEVMAQQALERLHYDKRTIELVRFLIREHLLMSHTSQRRDTDDTETITDFVRMVGSEGRLRMLTLLTFADLMALSESALTEWKKALLRDLYRKSLMLIGKGYEERFTASRKRDIESIVLSLAGDFDPVVIIRHLNLLPDRYMRVTSRRSVRRHLRGIERMERNGVWSSFRKSGDVSLLTVITRDYPRALSDICGVITASDINIVGARIFTREDGIIIDTFLVTGPDFGANIPAEIQRAFKSNIGRVIGRNVEVTSLIEDYRRRWKRRKRNVVFSPPRIRVHNDISSRHTVVDVFAIDYTGLLYDITSVLASLDIDIHTARIGTDEDQVADAFYIQGADGGKIEDAAAIETLKTAIIDRLNEAYG